MPIILLTALGHFLKKIKLISSEWAAGTNKMCFKIFLPLLLFMNIYDSDSLKDISWGLTIFSTLGILAAYIIGLFAIKIFIPEKRQKGVVLQCAFRSNYAILGMPLAIALFGQSGGKSAAILSLFTIPLFNVLSVIALSFYSNEKNSSTLKNTVKNIINNPLIISIFLGLLTLLLRLVFEHLGIAFRLSNIGFLYSALSNVSKIASPLALIVLGAQFSFKLAKGLMKQIIIGVSLRILIVPLIMLGIAYLFFPNFYGADFAALIALFGSPVAVSSSVMVSEMGGDIELATQLVFWSTLLSSATIFIFIFALKALGAL